MSDDGNFEGEGEFDEEIPYEEGLDDSSVEEEKNDSDDDEIEELEDLGDIQSDDELDAEIAPKKIQEKFKESKKIKINPVLQKSNTPRTIIVVADSKKITDNRLHKSESSNVLSMRSEQISKYGTNFINTDNIQDVFQIAIKELYARKCPLNLRRIVGIGLFGELIVEEWDINQMTLPPRESF